MSKPTIKNKPQQQADNYIANLFTVLSRLSADRLILLYGDLFTENEAAMLAKRLEIARGLLAGKSYLQIQKQLGVTANTVAQIQKVLKSGGSGFRSAAKLTASLEDSRPIAVNSSAGKSPGAGSGDKNNFFNSVFKKVFRSPSQQ